jgi:hypothetical protein
MQTPETTAYSIPFLSNIINRNFKQFSDDLHRLLEPKMGLSERLRLLWSAAVLPPLFRQSAAL